MPWERKRGRSTVIRQRSTARFGRCRETQVFRKQAWAIVCQGVMPTNPVSKFIYAPFPQTYILPGHTSPSHTHFKLKQVAAIGARMLRNRPSQGKPDKAGDRDHVRAHRAGRPLRLYDTELCHGAFVDQGAVRPPSDADGTPGWREGKEGRGRVRE